MAHVAKTGAPSRILKADVAAKPHRFYSAGDRVKIANTVRPRKYAGRLGLVVALDTASIHVELDLDRFSTGEPEIMRFKGSALELL